MNYIYDILVNFSYPLYDIFDWNKTDKIINIKKIPLIYISTNEFNDIKNNRIILLDSLKEIYNKTISFNNDVINYACVLCDKNEAIAVKFNKDGICIGKSRLLFDEENEILTSSSNIKKDNLNYKILKKDIIYSFRTRSEIKKYKSITKTINNIFDIEKLKYIYYECFNEYVEFDIKKKLLSKINVEWETKGLLIYNFLNVISMNK